MNSVSVDRVTRALERIAEALEARNAIDGQLAEFTRLLTQGAPDEDDLAPDGLPRKKQ